MIHTAAYTATVATSTTGALSTTTDPYLARYSTTQFVLPQPMSIVAAYGTIPLNSFTRAQVVAPSLLRVAYPNIRPLDIVASGAGSPADPNVSVLLDAPLPLRPAEGVGAQATAGAAPGRAFVALWLADKLDPVPDGDGFWIEYTIASATLTANDWVFATVTYTGGTLPEGYYAVVGFEHFCTQAIAARLVFPGQAARPGTVAQTALNNRTHRIFYEGEMGVLGTFHTSAPPNIEYLVNGTPTTAQTGYLRVIRIGGGRPEGDQLPASGGPAPSVVTPGLARVGGGRGMGGGMGRGRP
jgi:hypothetical protein